MSSSLIKLNSRCYIILGKCLDLSCKKRFLIDIIVCLINILLYRSNTLYFKHDNFNGLFYTLSILCHISFQRIEIKGVHRDISHAI